MSGSNSVNSKSVDGATTVVASAVSSSPNTTTHSADTKKAKKIKDSGKKSKKEKKKSKKKSRDDDDSGSASSDGSHGARTTSRTAKMPTIRMDAATGSTLDDFYAGELDENFLGSASEADPASRKPTADLDDDQGPDAL